MSAMMKVSNGKTIRRLGWRSMKAARTRNLIAVLAIALTTVLFTSLFTIAMSINDGFQQSNFRQVGGFSHGGFKYLTEEQFNNLKDDPLIDQWGMRRFIESKSKALIGRFSSLARSGRCSRALVDPPIAA